MGEAVKPAKFGEGIEKRTVKEALEDGLDSFVQGAKGFANDAKEWFGSFGQGVVNVGKQIKDKGVNFINKATWGSDLKDADKRAHEAVRTLEQSMKSVNVYAQTVEGMKAALDTLQSQSGGVHNESVNILKELLTKFDSWSQEVSTHQAEMTQILIAQREGSEVRAAESSNVRKLTKLDQQQEKGRQLKLIQSALMKQKDLENRALVVAERIVKELETMENKDITNSATTKLHSEGKKALTTLKDAFVKTSAAEAKMSNYFDRVQESVENTVDKAQERGEGFTKTATETKDGLEAYHKEDGERVKSSSEDLDSKRQEYEENLKEGTLGDKIGSGFAYGAARVKNWFVEGSHKETKTTMQKKFKTASEKAAKQKTIEEKGQEVLAAFERD